MSDDSYISIDQLRVGIYIDLDMKWFEHPFAFSHFKIKSEDQIRTLRSLGVRKVRFNPALSDAAAPPDVTKPTAPVETAKSEAAQDLSPALRAKQLMMQRIKAQREAAERIENAFIDTANAIRDVERNLFSRPEESLKAANGLVTRIADSILCAPDLAIHVMGDKTGGEEMYFHSLNVTTLAMMMARDIQLPHEVVEALGMGALLHDVGLKKIPDTILMKMDPLTAAEQHLYQMHCQYGVELGQQLQLPAAVLAIIRDHHEMYDGSGYPQKLAGESIGLLARIVAIASYYDELCNHHVSERALTPHETLSMMFAKLRSKFDPKLLQVFIRCLGVYPPGTIVQLSNGVIGMVATVNTAKPMKPMLVIYDQNIPKEEAILVDMERETDLNIVKAIRPTQVPQEIYRYLSPRKRVSYYFDAGKNGHEPGGR